MFYLLKIFLRDRWITVPLAASVVLQAILWWYVVVAITPTTSQVFLHYNIIFGIDRAGTWYELYYLLAGTLVFFFFNCAAAVALYARERVLARMVCVITPVWLAALAAGLYVIVGLNA